MTSGVLMFFHCGHAEAQFSLELNRKDATLQVSLASNQFGGKSPSDIWHTWDLQIQCGLLKWSSFHYYLLIFSSLHFHTCITAVKILSLNSFQLQVKVYHRLRLSFSLILWLFRLVENNRISAFLNSWKNWTLYRVINVTKTQVLNREDKVHDLTDSQRQRGLAYYQI